MNSSPTLQLTFGKFPLFLQTREEIGGQLMKLVDFIEYSRYFQEIYPSQGTQAMLTQRQRKFELFFNPSQARGVAWGATQARCSSAALPSDYITTPVALVKHCSSRGAVAEEQHRGAAGVQQWQGGWGASLWYVCCITITLLLTDVKILSKIDIHSTEWKV